MSTESFYYQELREMLQKPGCPVCHVGRKVARGQIDSLLYDSVTDKDSREKLAESLGFCNLHSRELLSFPGERLGATIIEWAVSARGTATSAAERAGWGSGHPPASARPDRRRVFVGAGRAVPGLPEPGRAGGAFAARAAGTPGGRPGRFRSRPQAACAGRIWTWQWPRPAIHVCTVHSSSSTATSGRA